MKRNRIKKCGSIVAAAMCACMLCSCLGPEAESLRREASGQEETPETTFLQEAAQNVRDNIHVFRERIGTGAEQEKDNSEEAAEQTDSGGRYVYGTLSEMEQIVYQEIYEALQQFADEIVVSTKDKTLLDNAYDAVYADYGELFWSSGYTYTEYTLGGSVRELRFAPKYTMSKEEKEIKAQQIDAVVQRAIAEAPVNGTDYERALYVYEYLIRHVEYDANAEDNQNIISVFLNGRTVCEGYARAAQYLLEQLGIQSAVVGGMAKGDFHAWNLMRLDGEYYYMDATWGDNGGNADQESVGDYINYNYFAITSEEISQSHHTPANTIELPECTATEQNYYVKNGLYVSEGLDQAAEILREHYEAGEAVVSLKFSNEALYHVAYTQWIADSGIFDLCSGLTNLYYTEDRDLYVLTFLF